MWIYLSSENRGSYVSHLDDYQENITVDEQEETEWNQPFQS